MDTKKLKDVHQKKVRFAQKTDPNGKKTTSKCYSMYRRRANEKGNFYFVRMPNGSLLHKSTKITHT